MGRAAAALITVLIAGYGATASPDPGLLQGAVATLGGVVDQATSSVVGVVDDTTGTVGDLLDDLLGPPYTPPTPAEVESAFLALTNKERVARGLRPLAMNADLVAVARRQSQRMASAGSLWHNTNIVRELTGWEALGENVGRGPTVNDIHVAFMQSPSHRVNVLDRGFTLVGMGAVVLPDGYIYITEDFEEPRGAATLGSTAGPRAAPSSAARRTPSRPDRTHLVEVLLKLVALDSDAPRTARSER